MNQKRKKKLIIVGTIGLIVLACIDLLIAIGVLFIAFIVWIASIDINKEESRYASSYFTSKQEHKGAKTPIEYGTSPHHIQLKSKQVEESIRAFADNLIDSKQGLIKSNDLMSFWGVKPESYQTLHKTHLDSLIHGLRKLGYGIVPNYQQGHKRLDYGESCVLYRLPAKSAALKTQIVRQAEIFIRLFGVLMNGRHYPTDTQHLNRCIQELKIHEDFHTYLHAYLLWLGQKKRPYDKRTKDAVALLPDTSKLTFRDLLTESVIVNGEIDNDRVENLKKILPTLDKDSVSVHSLLHKSLTDDGFATIERQNVVTEHSIRRPDEKKPTTLVLDQRKLSELKQQTEIAQSLLSDIFIDDNEEQTSSSPVQNTLMLDTLHKLLEKDTWQRDEVADMLGPGVMIGNLLEQINDYAYSIVDDIVVEEDGDTIYVTTEYKEDLI
jgi:hypothetical protein